MEDGRPLKLWIDPDGSVWMEDPDGKAKPLLEALNPAHAFAAPSGELPGPGLPSLAGWPAPQPKGEAEAWRAHRVAMAEWRAAGGPQARPAEGLAPEASLLALKLRLAQDLGRRCAWCFHRCGVDRQAGQRGWCKAGPEAIVGEAYVHQAEEREIAPSFLMALTGCSWRCHYCHVPELVHGVDRGSPMGPEARARWRQALEASEARSFSFVGGNPDQHLAGALAFLLAQAEGWRWPVVWNSNLSGSAEGYALLDGVVDLHLGDLRYGNEACALAHSAVGAAFQAPRAHLKALLDQGQRAIVRLLLLPGHVGCCLAPNLAWLKGHAPQVPVSLLRQYHPAHAARLHPDLGRVPSPQELAEAEALLAGSGLAQVARIEAS